VELLKGYPGAMLCNSETYSVTPY